MSLSQLLITLCLWLAIHVNAWAYVPDLKEQCELDNQALCEVNQITTMQAGDCPAGARTIRPPGTVDCDAYVRAYFEQQERADAEAQASAPSNRAAEPEKAPWYADGRLPSEARELIYRKIALVAGGLALLVILVRGIRRWRRAGQPLNMDAGIGLWLLAGGVGIYAAYALAAWSFVKIIDSFGNHDSFAPALLSFPLAGLVFLFAAPVFSGLLVLLVLMVNKFLQKRQGS